MKKKPTLSSLRKKVKELKGTLQELTTAIEKSTVPLEKGDTSTFSITLDKGNKILVYCDWLELLYKGRGYHTEGKDFLKEHFYIPDAMIDGITYWALNGKSIRVISDIPEIKKKFSKSFNTTIVTRTYTGKLETSQKVGKDAHKLIDIFDLIREHIEKDVDSLDRNNELKEKLSDIEGDLYELRQSADNLLEYMIKRNKEFSTTATIIGILIIVGIIIYYLTI